MIYSRIKNPDTSHVYDLMPRKVSEKKHNRTQIHREPQPEDKLTPECFIKIVIKITISMIIKLIRYLQFYYFSIDRYIDLFLLAPTTCKTLQQRMALNIYQCGTKTALKINSKLIIH